MSKAYNFTQEEISEFNLTNIIPDDIQLKKELLEIEKKLDIQLTTNVTAQQPGGPPCQCIVSELC